MSTVNLKIICIPRVLCTKGLRDGDLADFWPKTILEISGNPLNPLRTFSLSI